MVVSVKIEDHKLPVQIGVSATGVQTKFGSCKLN
jgi:hypothetical protein